MIIWQLPEKTDERPHGLKYRLFCGSLKSCLVRYDNEAGKGDHIHYGQKEVNYEFRSINQLVEDFRADCERLSDWRW
jgi:hypothetical protein